MDLEYLNGMNSLDDREVFKNFDFEEDGLSHDGREMARLDALEGVRAPRDNYARELRREQPRVSKEPQKDLKKFFIKELHAINKINPETILLRQGLLAAMKLNMMKVAGKLRYAYLGGDEARRHNLSFLEIASLKRVRDKVERYFHGLGGKQGNLKRAILTGQGNRNHAVSLNGFFVDGVDYDEHSSLEEILGSELYNSELLDENEEIINGLGAIATGTAIAAVTGFVASLAKVLKNVAVIQEKKAETKEQAAFSESNFAQNNVQSELPKEPLMAEGASPVKEEKKSFITKTRNWVRDNKGVSTLIIMGLLGIGMYGYKKYKMKELNKKRANSNLSGRPKKKAKKNKTKSKDNPEEFKRVKLAA